MLVLVIWALRRGSAGRRDLIAPPRAMSRPASSTPRSFDPRPAESVTVSDELRGEVWELARRGSKINAIKLLKDRTGLGLKDARDYVEAMRQDDVTLR